MPIQAILLILAAAVIHATWNFQVKKVQGGDAFTWLTSVISSVVLLPPVLYFYGQSAFTLSPVQWAAVAVSGALHMAYARQLQRGYAVADLSVVYPLARGTGPLLTVIAAVLFLGESPSWLGWLGVAGVVLGALVIAGADKMLHGGLHNPKTLLGVRYGFLIGLWIATYSVADGYAVKVLLVAPLVLDWWGNLMRAALLSPSAYRTRAEIAPLWQRAWGGALIVGALAPTSYILVLTALQYAPLSAVAPARELSMLIGAFLGAKLLAEGDMRRRLCGAGLIALGVAALALG